MRQKYVTWIYGDIPEKKSSRSFGDLIPPIIEKNSKHSLGFLCTGSLRMDITIEKCLTLYMVYPKLLSCSWDEVLSVPFSFHYELWFLKEEN